MKMSYGTLNMLGETLNRMSGLTGKAGYAIAKTKRMIRNEMGVYAELRDNLVKKYGSDDGKGAVSIKPGDAHWDEFIREFNELFVKETDVELFQLDEFDIDDIYCETAKADDYQIFEELMVKRKEGDADAGDEAGSVPGGGPEEPAEG